MFSPVLVFSLCIITISESAKILAIIPTPSVSHQVVFRPLTQELARRGHQVTVLTTDPVFKNGTPANLTEIDVHDISYRLWRDNFVYKFGQKKTVLPQMDATWNIMRKLTVIHLKHEKIQELMKNPTQFDILLVEAWTRQTLVYSYIFKVPVILVSSFGMMIGNAETLGTQSHPILYPLAVQQRLYNLTFWEKLDEFYKYWCFSMLWYKKENEEMNTFREVLGPDVPEYCELKNNVHMLFLNIHTMWIENQPLPPNVISIWGIHKKPEKPLPKDLETYLDSSKHGVVYISFGTNVPSTTLPEQFIQTLIRVFSTLPYDVLWKWEADEMPGKSTNIKISKWLPQSDLLRHKNVKLFVTQGGLQSTEEAITAGVPLIGIPMLADQWYNVKKYEKHRIGVRLDMETITEGVFSAAIKTVINDPSYKENIIRLRHIMADQPVSALDRAVWWTEYVLRHGGAKHLRAAGANMSWIQYYETEFTLKSFMIIVISFGIMIGSLYLCMRKVVFSKKVKVA
ncbi:UDP-glycosyltransferase UGT5-like [Pieris napi]|uniref:UDP-glycosyltransferase UGT5-like n=1 Tax=Pieris napi TaxID=78633 RepID=UPI001FB9A4F0|nr:UDP-glycosyltransferase UGT5-like [Pieris napi]